MGKIVIVKRKNKLLLLLTDDRGKPSFLQEAPLPEEESILGNIYIARVKDVVPGISAAFLSIGEETVFLPLPEKEALIHGKEPWKEEEGKPALHQGDEIVVQITGEAQKTKQPSASANPVLTGQYCVCRLFGHGIHYSKKLSDVQKTAIKKMLADNRLEGRKQFEFTIRTNAGALQSPAPLLEEMQQFIQTFRKLLEVYSHRTCFSCLYRTEPEIQKQMKGIPLCSYDEIVTDLPSVFELLSENAVQKKGENLCELPEGKTVRLYKDELLPLDKLYSVDTHLKEVFSKKVWLPCGGYLVIEPTEAMVVIDVNSGKAESKKKNAAGFYYKVNEEAAKEIARQLRLRNYSGMIMVDFINMESEEERERLLDRLDGFLKEDLVHTRLVDMTALGIVEITRKKVNKPLDIRLL